MNEEERREEERIIVQRELQKQAAAAQVQRIMAQERRDKAEQKRSRLCEHMRALILHCETVGVVFGGCGECGSAWLTCLGCRKTVDEAHEAFTMDYEQFWESA